MTQKVTKEVGSSRGDAVSRILVAGIFILLAVMMIGGLRSFILYPAGQVDQDIMPSVLGFYFFFLWITQFPLYLRFRKRPASGGAHASSDKEHSFLPLITLFLFIICSFFLSAVILSYCDQIRLVTENGLPFSLPGFREMYLFLLQMGNSLWYLDFPWGLLAFPMIGTLAYLPFCFFWSRKEEPKRAVRFTGVSSGVFLLVSLLFSFSVQAIVVVQEGWPLPPQSRIEQVKASGLLFSGANSRILSANPSLMEGKALLDGQALWEGNAVSSDKVASEEQRSSEGHIAYRYDRQKALNYAAKWFGAYNPTYYAYSQDCANFVSQCLYAGGMPMASSWHPTVDGKEVAWGAVTARNGSAHKDSIAKDSGKEDPFEKDSISPTWRLAQKLFAYYAASQTSFINGSVLTVNSSTNIHEVLASAAADGKFIQPGDLLFFAPEGRGEDDINHAVFITGVSGDEIYFSSHNCSRLNEALSPHLSHKSVFIVRLNDVG